ncbi:hypothetical protein GCM10011335_49080 [Aureimonas glaciei]|uniref:L-serine ammonia-lyase n=2 Tax=Aureimonas glaciei TaxID=1776957 RepID=A0A916YD59_9HYPH|nr:hypothetical protein GCM10011335_49080 [Aureimonas glaciei]
MIDEVARLGISFDCVIVAVGGGGLMSGVAEGLDRNGLAHVPIVAVETEGAASLAGSMAAGHRIELSRITTVATSLGARKVCERAFELTRSRSVISVVVDDQTAVDASLRLLDDHRVLVEPACGAVLATLYGAHEALAPYRSVLAIVCGGATVSVEWLQAWRPDPM